MDFNSSNSTIVLIVLLAKKNRSVDFFPPRKWSCFAEHWNVDRFWALKVLMEYWPSFIISSLSFSPKFHSKSPRKSPRIFNMIQLAEALCVCGAGCQDEGSLVPWSGHSCRPRAIFCSSATGEYAQMSLAATGTSQLGVKYHFSIISYKIYKLKKVIISHIDSLNLHWKLGFSILSQNYPNSRVIFHILRENHHAIHG